jgi:hypothetical protein
MRDGCYAHKCGGVKPMDGIPTILDNWIPSSNADKTKNEQIRFYSHRPYAMITMNDNINMDSTSAGAVFIDVTREMVVWSVFIDVT